MAHKEKILMLVEVDELVGVEQDVAEGEESFFTDGGFGGPLFLFGRVAAEGEGEPEAGLCGGLLRGFLLEALGEVAGLLEHEGIVAEGEGLQGRCGDEALGGEVGWVGTVLCGEELVWSGADHEAVDTAPPKLGLVGRDVLVDRRVGLDVLEVAETGAACLQVQFAGGGEYGVTQGLGVEAPWVLPPEQAVVGVCLSTMGGMGDLPVGGAVQNDSLDCLERPLLG